MELDNPLFTEAGKRAFALIANYRNGIQEAFTSKNWVISSITAKRIAVETVEHLDNRDSVMLFEDEYCLFMWIVKQLLAEGDEDGRDDN